MSAKGSTGRPETVYLTHPTGTRVRVAADVAAKYTALGYLSDNPKPKGPEGPPSESWTVGQLKSHAAQAGVDLDGATKKADILAAIEAAHDTEPDE